MSPVDMRVGWCPGALRPMPSGDGLVVRVKPRGGTLAPEIAAGIAEAAARHGNGAIDLTGRANLQIRGVEDGSLAGLTRSLAALGLLDTDAGAEARRNVVASPLAGLDPWAAFDIRPAVAALEDRLAVEVGLSALPAKFGFAMSDDGAMRLCDVSADVRFDAVRSRDGRQRFAVRLDREEGVAAFCDAGAVAEVAVQLADVFVDARAGDPTVNRMRDLVARVRGRAILERAGLVPVSASSRGSGSLLHHLSGGPPPPQAEEDLRLASSAGRRRGTARSAVEEAGPPQVPPAIPMPFVGRIDLPFVGKVAPGADCHVLGIAAPFGRLDAAQLDALARGALLAGASEMRLTPWRAILVPSLGRLAAERLASDCAAAGWIVDPRDPRLRVAACVGAPGCRRGTTAVLDHAVRWAALLGPGHAAGGIALHVSGCAKGCAHPGPAPLTLVAEEGRYGVVADGSAADAASAVGLDTDEVRRLLRIAMGWDRLP